MKVITYFFRTLEIVVRAIIGGSHYADLMRPKSIMEIGKRANNAALTLNTSWKCMYGMARMNITLPN